MFFFLAILYFFATFTRGFLPLDLGTLPAAGARLDSVTDPPDVKLGDKPPGACGDPTTVNVRAML